MWHWIVVLYFWGILFWLPPTSAVFTLKAIPGIRYTGMQHAWIKYWDGVVQIKSLFKTKMLQRCFESQLNLTWFHPGLFGLVNYRCMIFYYRYLQTMRKGQVKREFTLWPLIPSMIDSSPVNIQFSPKNW